MRRIRTTHEWPTQTLSVAGLVLSAFFFGPLAFGQAISPSAPPPGGQTAPTLNASTQTQKKTGSLVIGTQSAGTCDFGVGGNLNGCARLCLNATAGVDPATSVDSSVCIRSWNELSTTVSGAYLPLSSASFASIPTKIGYARLQGNALVPSTTSPVTQPYTLHVTSGSDIGATALFVDGRLSDNNAGYFWGRVAIGNSLSGTPGRICLNSTNNKASATPTELANGTYCISTWTDISPASPSDKLTLQTALSPVAETGSVNIDRTFAAGSFVIGDPVALPASLSGLACGDGMCSANETAGSCAIDCATVNQVASFTGSSGTNQTSLNITTGTQAGSPSVRILVVRSTNPNFSFQPVDGTIYPVGGNSAFAVVDSSVRSANTALPAIIDSGYGMSGGQPFYYRVFQSNIYPRYAPVPKTLTLTPTSSSVGGCGTCGDGPIDPEIVPMRK